MPIITFNPAAIGVNTTSIASNQTVASDAALEAAVASAAASDAESVAAVASGAASDAESDAAVASDAASVADSKAIVASDAAADAQSDATSIAGDDKFAKSIISDPSSESFAILTMQVTSASLMTLSHSTTAV